MRIAEGFVLRDVMGQATVIGEGVGQINFNRLVIFNDTAAFLWRAVGNEDFDEEMMIPQFQYTLQKESSICLSAPKGAVTYEWLIELPNPDSENNSGTSTSRTLITRSVSQSSTLYYTPSNTIKVGILYILTLNATTKEGTVYTDNADIIFYE